MLNAIAFLFLVACCKLGQADFAFTCDDDIITVSPPVVNASAYGYELTISIEGQNKTLEAYELYNPNNGSIFLRVNYPNESNTDDWIMEMINHDYVYNQTLHVFGGWGDQHKCRVTDLMHNETYSIFGMGIENGFQNPEFSYKWTGDYNYTQGNDTIINGIPAKVYSTCLLFNNSQMKYDVDLYFSGDDWNMRSGDNTPLLVVLKANSTVDGGSKFDTETYTYSFTSYHQDSGKKYPMFFPDDLICPDRKDYIPYPYMGNNYAATEEVVIPERKQFVSWRQHYNYDEKLYRVDFVAPRNSSRPHTPKLYHHHYTVIHDFHSGVEYVIDRETGNCATGPLTNAHMWARFDVETDPLHPGFFRMRSQLDFLTDLNMTYTGRHKHRTTGVTYDSWTSGSTYKANITWGFYELRETHMFTTLDWNNGDMARVPIGVKAFIKVHINGTVTNKDMMIHMSNVLPLGHGIHVFDVGMCQTENTRRTFVLKFSDTYAKYLSDHSTQIDVGIQEAVSLAAQVAKIRVSSFSSKEVALDQSSGKDSAEWRVFITVTLYDRPPFHGNTTEYYPGINITDAVYYLSKAVQNNKLTIKFKISDAQTISMTAFPDYFVERGSLYSPPPSSGHTTKTGLSNGAVAAICIAMTLIGFVAGAVVCHFRYKRGNRQFGYGIQD